MAAVNPEDIGPGEDAGPDQATVDQVNSAVNQGYSYADISAYHAENSLPQPPQPSLDAIMSGSTNDASQWSAPPANPYALDTPEQASPLIHQLAEAGVGIGAVEGAAARIIEGAIAPAETFGAAATRLSNAYVEPAVGGLDSGRFFQDLVAKGATTTNRLGVETTTAGLQGRMTATDLAVERGAQTAQQILGNKWVRRGAGAAAAEAAYRNPDIFGERSGMRGEK